MMGQNVLFSEETFQKILKQFAYATGLATVMVDIHGEEMSEHYNFNDFCNLMRQKPEYRERCEKCDLFGGLEALKSNKVAPYKCHAGLVDIAVPVIIKNQLVGFILSGQVLVEKVPFHSIYPASDWRKHPDLVSEFNKLKASSPKQIENAAELLKILTEHYFPINDQNNVSEFIRYDLNAINPKDYSTTAITDELFEKANQSVMFHHHLRSEITEALSYIDDNLLGDISLSKVSSHVYLQPSYFSKIFKKETGFTFIDYTNRKKIIKSMLMLKDPTQSIETISHRLGYQHPSYYTKLFKKILGTTPAEYRRHLR